MEIRFDQSQDFDVGFVNTAELAVSETQDQRIDVSFSEGGSFACSMGEGSAFEVDFGNATEAGDYDGPYSVTPSTSAQTLNTANKTLAHNVTIGAIPSNYGLITWNGSTLTVS